VSSLRTDKEGREGKERTKGKRQKNQMGTELA